MILLMIKDFACVIMVKTENNFQVLLLLKLHGNYTGEQINTKYMVNYVSFCRIICMVYH